MAKKDEFTQAPNKNLAIAAVSLIFIGISWFAWELFLRPENEAEKKARIQHEKDLAFEKRFGRKPGH